MVGDTVNLHAPRDTGFVEGGERLVKIVVNGQVAASKKVPADGKPHDLRFEVPIARSSWIAVRQFPQLHTNPVNVIVQQQPIRASRGSALWCAEYRYTHMALRKVSGCCQSRSRVSQTDRRDPVCRNAHHAVCRKVPAAA